MGGDRRILGWGWPHHLWQRRVTHSERLLYSRSDQWGRVVPIEHVLCQTELVCTECGAVRDVSSCGCEPEEAERCPVRLAWLAEATRRAEVRA